VDLHHRAKERCLIRSSVKKKKPVRLLSPGEAGEDGDDMRKPR
jgi:hypothetical protein